MGPQCSNPDTFRMKTNLIEQIFFAGNTFAVCSTWFTVHVKKCCKTRSQPGSSCHLLRSIYSRLSLISYSFFSFSACLSESVLSVLIIYLFWCMMLSSIARHLIFYYTLFCISNRQIRHRLKLPDIDNFSRKSCLAVASFFTPKNHL